MKTGPLIRDLLYFALFAVFFGSVAFASVDAADLKVREQVSVKKPVYSAGPWRGRIVEAETGKPIEGALVAAVWYRSFDTGFTLIKDFHEAREVFTDNNGYFEIPAYTETGDNKDTWRRPQQPGPEGPIELAVRRLVITDPDFIIYKPTYNSYPRSAEIMIFASAASMIKYREFYMGTINNELVRLQRQKTKDFPEGLVYTGRKCFSVMAELLKKTNFRFDTLFIPMKNALEKLEELEIPLDCPESAEPVPTRMTGGKRSFESPLKKGGFIVIGLSRATRAREREAAIPMVPVEAGPDKLPRLHRLIDEEKENIKTQGKME
ncbi:hypothetical protein BMS3Abin10_02174 [bacterium BMS3Abin10]|nr:hypothetical protein BMS3Abin10_02174 [bacterium BMS3Abin10]